MSCKSCERLTELASQNELELIEEQLELELNIAEDDVRDKRLSICMNCPFLKGQTCTKCGCYALFRASLSDKQCPVNKW
ncbi:DUF6171 family protein [Alkalibacterium pelagium]|uniref:DUF6171 family protein n=1 Tax=Alkalibacterium pelagium TaxID=426702 RepID=UPI000B85DC7B|nr:DUF6171 family protein [Alkalibacterium pelagium]GEN50485.1 hypothetical protein APE02nite_11500 [Alkalibacterium pelagium]